ncbi:DUF4114 domain-containing protein, partial [Microcoleus sp. PH2017_08_TRC_O_A]|uniref:DUF4114 domain-containing protein n=1 Tax=Microcoleus sp. PH2017_08_TRC_O_A TaxID=2798819 RepID=UPI001D299F95
MPTKNESIITAEIDSGTVKNEIAFPEITTEIESEQLPTKTDSLATAEFTAGTIELDITVAFTAAELETETPPAVAVNPLEPEPLISHSKSSVQTEQRTSNFQRNTNSPTNLSITAAANSPSGTFLVDDQGQVKFDYQFDGGYFTGEVGIFSLAGMSAFIPGTPEFIAEASRRVLSNSTDGHIVISDSTEGAKFTGAMPFDGDWGSGEYQGIKTFSMLPGDTFAVMLVPNATIQSSFQSSYSGNLFPENRPLFSIATANPNDTAHLLQIADITGTGNTFALEDMSPPNSDRDYNDLIFKISGATGNAPLLDTVINPDREWRNTTLGQQLLGEANPPNSDNNPPVVSPTSARTYTELETTISLDNLATDAEA